MSESNHQKTNEQIKFSSRLEKKISICKQGIKKKWGRQGEIC